MEPINVQIYKTVSQFGRRRYRWVIWYSGTSHVSGYTETVGSAIEHVSKLVEVDKLLELRNKTQEGT